MVITPDCSYSIIWTTITHLIFSSVSLTVHLGIFISVINQLDAQHFCFTISLFHASTCFEHMCSSSGGQNCIIQHLVSSHLYISCLYMFRAHVLIIRRSKLYYTASGIITPVVHCKYFKYFIIILIVSTNCIFVQLLDNKVFYVSWV